MNGDVIGFSSEDIGNFAFSDCLVVVSSSPLFFCVEYTMLTLQSLYEDIEYQTIQLLQFFHPKYCIGSCLCK